MRTQPADRTGWKFNIPTTRFAWIVLAVALLASSTAVYAIAPGLRQLFRRGDAGLLHIEQVNLGQEVNLTQTTNGLMVNLNRVYADANRIVVGYTVSGAALTNDFAMALTLRDEAGTIFPVFEERSTGVQNGTRSFIASFDGAGVRGTSSKLQLTMEPGQTQRSLNQTVASRWSALGAPLRFDVEIGRQSDHRVVDLRESVTAAGVTLVLEQVRVSRTGVNAILCDRTEYKRSSVPRWLSVGRLATEVVGVEQVQSDASGIGTEGCHTLRFPAAHYYNQPGKWTLTVTELTVSDHASGLDKRVAGPWTFEFTVPGK